LSAAIDKLIEFIQSLNSELGNNFPKFNEDLRRSQKRKGGKTCYSLNFSLLCNGVHPDNALAKAWLTSLLKNIERGCV
jgi:hypothetical protein